MTSLAYVQQKEIRQDHCPPGNPGAESQWEKLFFIQPPHQRRTHVHIRIQGRANQRYALLFRDYLRQNSDTARSYAEIKRRLALNLADPHSYPKVKDPVVDMIYFAAEQWAETTHWQEGKPDA